MAFAYPFNLLRLGNSISWWLGIAPWQLFFYVFLPPLLLDAAVRIDWFIFRKVDCFAFFVCFCFVFVFGLLFGSICLDCGSVVSAQVSDTTKNTQKNTHTKTHTKKQNKKNTKKIMVPVLTLAFVVVGVSCALMVPLMMYAFNLRRDNFDGSPGWNWAQACMFGAMVASTDAVAIVAIMKTAGGPKRLRSILEGESLLNDASGLTLFEIFFHKVQIYAAPGGGDALAHENFGNVIGGVLLMVLKMGGIGFCLGLAFGIATRMLLRLMRRIGATKDQEVALTLANAYLAYWVTSAPAGGSGVVAVAVMGLYGAATNHWDMSTRAEEEGTFDGFWETLAFTVNSIVFLYSGASCVNFFIRSMMMLEERSIADMAHTLWMLPVIYVALNLLRFILTVAFRPLFIAVRGDINTREAVFVSAAGLRGSVSLIMGQAVVTDRLLASEIPVVQSEIVFWTAGFVFLTLLVNAPMLPTLLRWTKLNAIPPRQLLRRRRAIEALEARTAEAVDELRTVEDELLSGIGGVFCFDFVFVVLCLCCWLRVARVRVRMRVCCDAS